MKEKLPDLLQTCLVFAARYAYQRQTGAALAVVSTLEMYWEQLDPHTRKQIYRESKNEALYCKEDWKIIWDLFSTLYREDGEKFVLNRNGTYSMENAKMANPHTYSYEQLMETGTFSHFKPN